MSKVIIVIFGRKFSGKTTTARAIRSLLDDAKVDSFADPIKKGVAEMFGIPMKNMRDPVLKEKEVCFGKTIRYLLQTLGTEWGKDLIDPSVWTWLAMQRVHQATQRVIIFDDGRFPKEEGDWVERYCQAQGWTFYKFKVERKSDNVIGESIARHRSETSLDGVAMPTLYNTGTKVSTLKKNIEQFVKFRILNEIKES